LDHVRAALSAARDSGVDILLLSSPGAARYAGADHLKKIVDLAVAENQGPDPDVVIDCGEGAGPAMWSLRVGWKLLAFSGDATVKHKIADMAAQCGARLVDVPAEALDLIDEANPEAACLRWLNAPN
jgi:hypothetical protein